MKEKFSVTGMSCAACSAGIERTLNKKEGIKRADVSLMGECMTVEYDESVISRQQIIDEVLGLGYGASVFDERSIKAEKPQPNRLKKRFLLSLLFLLPLMYFSMGGMVGFPQPHVYLSISLQAALSLAVIVVNFKFFTSGTKALLKKVPNMDTLVSIGSGVSFVYSLVCSILVFVGKYGKHTHMFYESAAMILTLVTLGKWFEERSKRKTGEEVEKLIRLMPNTVTIEENGIERKIEFTEISVGDILIVKQGEYVPVDGRIVEGHAFLDRAAITGESMPIEAEEGSLVTGADVVKSGYIKVLAEKVGADTTLSQIVKMVKEAGASKAPLQKLADKIAGVFVPAVLLIAAVTFLVWWTVSKEFGTAANYAIAVLVISCPCSLGLATPVAVMAATGRGMALGILYKDAEALQKAKDINCVLLDKTATLT
ncbi:MAG: heavy metal translocating P-type ATPase, partial [Clostridia bacterium]|nr:heavy metal translocating P-type ATPase [Clostridia bacterium]